MGNACISLSSISLDISVSPVFSILLLLLLCLSLPVFDFQDLTLCIFLSLPVCLFLSLFLHHVFLFAVSPSFFLRICEFPFPPPPLHPCLGLGADSAWCGNSTGIREPLPHVGTAYKLPSSWPHTQQSMSQLLNDLGETPLREGPPMSPLPLAGGPASFFLPPAQ